MTIKTPGAENHAELNALSSRYVNVDDLPWRETPFPGVEIKILMQDDETGKMTSLTRLAPGAVLPQHEHVGLEQTFVLSGSLQDDEGAVTEGNYVWRPAGSIHVAHSEDGCLVLGMFEKPNRFINEAND